MVDFLQVVDDFPIPSPSEASDDMEMNNIYADEYHSSPKNQ
jgi:hypothetical protein